MNINDNLVQTMSNFSKTLENIPSCDLSFFNKEDTLVVMIDMINGFAKFGALASPNVKKLIPKMDNFLSKATKHKLPILAYKDVHTSENSIEFDFYPQHCIKGSEECEIVSELQKYEMKIIEKNSTNAFLAYNPLKAYPKAKNFLVIGCVTDICIKDFSTTLSKYLQEKDIKAKVYVIENLVDTYHIPAIHDRDVEHLLALYQMKKSGVDFLTYNKKN